jgi:hypothetical protein
MKPIICSLVCGLGALASASRADVVTMIPVADSFVDSAQPDFNYGGAGAMQIAPTGSPNGEFQAVIRFDTSTAVAMLDASLGQGNWRIQSITLQLAAAPPNNPIFNPATAGQFAVSWMQNDSWIEGNGMPNTPDTNGITFNTLSNFIGPDDEPLGTFACDGATTEVSAYTLSLASGFAAAVAAGGPVSLRLSVPQAGVYTFHSRSFGTVTARPVLTITAIARCGSADFNGDGAFGTDADIDAFFACLSGNCCPTCGSADFNGDGATATDADIEAFFRVLAGGSC